LLLDLSFAKLTETFWLYFKAYGEHVIMLLHTPSWNNYFYWVGFWFLFCFVLELILPKKIEYSTVKRKGFWLDLFYVFFNDFIFSAIGFFALTVVVEMLYHNLVLAPIGLSADFKLFDIQNYHFAIQVGVLFILQDFLEFLAHFLLHRVGFLWKFHKIHHAQEQLGAASTRHFHWMEYLVFKPILYIPFSLIGYESPEYIMFVLTLGVFSSFFTHSNIDLKLGFLNYIINNPNTHFWHHAKNYPTDKYRYGVNFASVLNIWDYLFGSYYLPKDKPLELGVDDNHLVPDGFLGQTVYPFKEIFSRKKTEEPSVSEEIVEKEQITKKGGKKKKKKKK